MNRGKTITVVKCFGIILALFVLTSTVIRGAQAYGDFTWMEDDEEGVYSLSDERAVLYVGLDYGDSQYISFAWYDSDDNKLDICPEDDEPCTASTYVYGGGVIVGKRGYFYINGQNRLPGTYTVKVREPNNADPVFVDTFTIEGPRLYLPIIIR